MATPFVLAIAADGEVGTVGQRRQEPEEVSFVWRAHLGAIPPGKCRPLALRRGRLRGLDQLRARRQFWKPDVVPVLRSVLILGYTAGRTPHRTDAKAFATRAWAAQPND